MQQMFDHWRFRSDPIAVRQGCLALVRSALRGILPAGWRDAWPRRPAAGAAISRHLDAGARSPDLPVGDRMFAAHAAGTTDAAAFRFSLR
jgi:hypothetical protein